MKKSKEIEHLTQQLVDFFEEREWTKWHSPKNIVMALASEVGELVDPFRFFTEEESLKLDKKSRETVSDELGDVMIFVTYLAHLLKMDPIKAALKKMKKNSKRYPPALVRGKREKYTHYKKKR
jgi:dCTP diphosphatase